MEGIETVLTKEAIEARIAELEAERVRLVEAANQRLAALSGKIEVWNEMLEMMESEDTSADHPA